MRAVLEIKDRFGKNAILRGTNFLAAGTQRERNEMIGGHRVGYKTISREYEESHPMHDASGGQRAEYDCIRAFELRTIE